MNVPICRVVSIGELTPWGERFIDTLRTETIADVSYHKKVQPYLETETVAQAQIVFVEATPEMSKIVEALRKSEHEFYIVVFGKIISKEDAMLAIRSRIYQVFENIAPNSQEVIGSLEKLAERIDKEKRFDLLIRSLKSVLIEAEGDLAHSVMGELKTAVTKLGSTGAVSEFSESKKKHREETENKLLFYQSESLSEALETIDSLERTGVLWVKGALPEQEGEIGFLQGKIISATSGVVHGLKAIFRMFLWDNLQYVFTRRDHDEMEVGEPINVSIKHISVEGTDYRKLFEKVRPELPPGSMRLQLNPSFLHPGVSLEPEDFSTLASVVEFGTVSNVLDYNPLPDSLIYASLINLRKLNMLSIQA